MNISICFLIMRIIQLCPLAHSQCKWTVCLFEGTCIKYAFLSTRSLFCLVWPRGGVGLRAARGSHARALPVQVRASCTVRWFWCAARQGLPSCTCLPPCFVFKLLRETFYFPKSEHFCLPQWRTSFGQNISFRLLKQQVPGPFLSALAHALCSNGLAHQAYLWR
jgi:hypothetical protein